LKRHGGLEFQGQQRGEKSTCSCVFTDARCYGALRLSASLLPKKLDDRTRPEWVDGARLPGLL
jgi:hypothetical protein